MTVRELLTNLIAESDRLHPTGDAGAEAWNLSEQDGLPNFSTAANGSQRVFSSAALSALRDLTEIKYENDRDAFSAMQIGEFGRLVRQCVTDLHAAGQLAVEEIDASSEVLGTAIATALSQVRK